MTKRIGLLAGLALLALPQGAAAQNGPMEGCWRDPGPEVTSTGCFEEGGVATFSLRWALDDGSGWTQGDCSGLGKVTYRSGRAVTWEVPRQDQSCFQDGAWDRLARRLYECTVDLGAMTCTVHVYLDDGTEWGDPAVGVVYDLQ